MNLPDLSALSLILPCRNESGILVERLQALQGLRSAGAEIILVDGLSEDGSADLAEPWVDQLLQTPPGRARQMNRGAQMARGRVLWFLHVDSLIPDPLGAAHAVVVAASVRGWGRFEVRLDAPGWRYVLVAWAMNRRSCWTGVVTGDHGVFVKHALFDAVGGFPDQPLMEDLELSRRLRRRGRPACLRRTIETSARRWQRHGWLHTVALMWGLRLAYWAGVPAERLVHWYPQCTDPKP